MEDGSLYDTPLTKVGESTTVNPYSNREPRFYATIGYDGAVWGRERPTDSKAYDPTPLGNLQMGYYEVSDGGKVEIELPNKQTVTFNGLYGVDTRKSSIEDWNGSFTGYVEKKLIDGTVAASEQIFQVTPYPYIRLAEMYLIAAEACIELNRLDEAATYLDALRGRIGRPDTKNTLAIRGKSFIQNELREFLQQERRSELAYEESRYYDVRRWMIADREPRFYASVAYNGAYWYLGNEKEIADRNKQIFYYRGKRDGYNAGMFWLRTGIGVMKYVHPDDTYQNNSIDNLRYKPEPAIRYADILLMYAEAINEVSEGTYDIPSWDGAKTHSIHRSVAEMRKGIKPVRMRAGVPDFDNNIYADKDVFRIYLKRERQIELMGEGKRYYDIRRWKDARVEEAMPVYGCNTLMTESDREMFHTPIAVWNLSATFSDKMWFWPISHGELKRNKRLTQNPGWTYND